MGAALGRAHERVQLCEGDPASAEIVDAKQPLPGSACERLEKPGAGKKLKIRVGTVCVLVDSDGNVDLFQPEEV